MQKLPNDIQMLVPDCNVRKILDIFFQSIRAFLINCLYHPKMYFRKLDSDQRMIKLEEILEKINFL